MKQFISNYHHLLAIGVYLLVANLREPKVFDIFVISWLVSYAAFKGYLEAKGKVLDKDQLLNRYEEMFVRSNENAASLAMEMESTKKEIADLKSKLSLATSRNTNPPSGAKW